MLLPVREGWGKGGDAAKETRPEHKCTGFKSSVARSCTSGVLGATNARRLLDWRACRVQKIAATSAVMALVQMLLLRL